MERIPFTVKNGFVDSVLQEGQDPAPGLHRSHSWADSRSSSSGSSSSFDQSGGSLGVVPARLASVADQRRGNPYTQLHHGMDARAIHDPDRPSAMHLIFESSNSSDVSATSSVRLQQQSRLLQQQLNQFPQKQLAAVVDVEEKDEAGLFSGRPGMAAVGSQLHDAGKCRPCAWTQSSSGCRKGAACHFCHENHETRGNRRRPCKATRSNCDRIVQMLGEHFEANDPKKLEAARLLAAESDYIRRILVKDGVDVGGEEVDSSAANSSGITVQLPPEMERLWALVRPRRTNAEGDGAPGNEQSNTRLSL
mmetsp:Transcript_31604/g.56742  ORF Transcript_31604/g.56742 Transcript_31604/m.56742 type:complete len:307 (+) Transcript_31604:212-1132(+)